LGGKKEVVCVDLTDSIRMGDGATWKKQGRKWRQRQNPPLEIELTAQLNL
jgi:hypothetical protein